MSPGLLIVLYLIFGVIAAVIASQKGRSTVGWFFGGALLGIIGIVIVAVLPNLKAEEARRKHALAERRRLKEQLRQEKMKTESFRRHASYRLDTHDTALGMETRRPPGLSAGASTPTPPPLGSALPEALWFYEEHGKPQGPVPLTQLTDLLRQGTLHWDALVWTEGQGDWVAASTVPALQDLDDEMAEDDTSEADPWPR